MPTPPSSSQPPSPEFKAIEDKPSSVGTTAGFESRDLVNLFGVIDKLRECGVSEDISLPQIVVVGDQSSGKSSVLEALTEIPFPIASTLCTRYATQINFKRTPMEYVSVSITPCKDSSANRQLKLRGFKQTIHEGLDEKRFGKLLEDAAEIMGLPKPGVAAKPGESGIRFSDDTLKIELCGPDKPHFSVVDVPGLFQSATTYQTDEDAEVVENLVMRYMQSSRTIILAVASSLHETANQKVFHLCKKADPKGQRTVGLLTKPDALQAGDEDRILQVARNRVTELTHGWFLVRNRSTEEVRKGVNLAQRLQNEKRFFASPPWNGLDRSRVGIKSLEKFLRTLLFQQIRKEYPKLREELDLLVKECREEIDDLGPPRESPEQQRSALLQLSTDWQFLARSALGGYYRNSLDVDGLRLRAAIRRHNDLFASNIIDHGHLHDLADETKTATIHSWIRDVSVRSRGTELEGMANPEILKTLFRLQTEKWEPIARAHLTNIREEVEAFNKQLLALQCSDEDLRARITSRLAPAAEAAYRRADDELARILDSERGEILLTHDPTFKSTLDETRNERYCKDLSGRDHVANPNTVFMPSTTSIAALAGRIKTRDSEANTDMFEYLEAYYNLARTRYVDCVCMQVVERHFLGPDGPVRVFSPLLVGKMGNDELEAIAGEDMGTVGARQALSERFRRLQEAQRIAGLGYAK
ncbi:P-loop containing nucleoside triphosphate hydrolase protein [Geopyxis carbonaria]|nr:P-loop containing nucleoside triphosphate hydrolase protein [Geopyxis carbonaria]